MTLQFEDTLLDRKTAAAQVQSALTELPRAARVGDVPLAEIDAVAAPQATFVARLDDLAAAKLGEPRFAGVRYLLLAKQRPVAWADVPPVLVESSGPPRRPSFTVSPHVVSTERALVVAEGLEELKAGDYALRVLTSPPLPLAALWLHPLAAGGADIVIPLDPAPPGLKPLVRYGMQQFLDAIAPAAKDLLGASFLGDGGTPIVVNRGGGPLVKVAPKARKKAAPKKKAAPRKKKP